MFSREVATAYEAQASDSILPVRGSEHPGFVEMLFLWGAVLDEDPRFRRVMLPSGFTFAMVDDSRSEIRDLAGNIRAVVLTPQEGRKIPAISPVRRYSLGAEQVDSRHRGVVYDRGSAVFRTKLFSAQPEAIASARKWLDESKPRWESYISAVNFE